MLISCIFLGCSKQVIQTKIYPKKVSKLSYFCKKRKNWFAFLFWDLCPKSQIFTPDLNPPFWKFFIKYIEQGTNPSAKNRLTGPVKNRSTGRSTGDDFEIYRSGRAEKILTGSISALLYIISWNIKKFICRLGIGSSAFLAFDTDHSCSFAQSFDSRSKCSQDLHLLLFLHISVSLSYVALIGFLLYASKF